MGVGSIRDESYFLSPRRGFGRKVFCFRVGILPPPCCPPSFLRGVGAGVVTVVLSFDGDGQACPLENCF